MAGSVSVVALIAAGQPAYANTRTRLIWWGNPERDKRTYAVVDKFLEMNGDTTVDPETYSWGDYWTKLATLAAGKNLPDVIQMDYRYIFEYARRGQLAPLDDFIGNELELADFDKNLLNSGKIDGKIYGVAMGANSMSYVYNETVRKEIGLELPDPIAWTNDDFTALGNSVKDALPKGMYFVRNMGRLENVLETWTRQRGKDLYTADGGLGFDLQDLEDFWQLWFDLQEAGLTPPADVMAQDNGKMDEMMLVNRRSLFDFLHSNQLVAAQKLIEDEIGITMIPNQTGGQPGQYMKPSMLLSMAANSGDPSAAAKLINFIITAPEANDILLVERGVSGDASIRERIKPTLTQTEQKMINYLDAAATHVSPLPPPPPKGAGEIERAFRPAWEAVAFGQKPVKQGAKDFFDFAQMTLERA
ncbi:MAG: extracellular solute-binding protein [Rhodobacteraceae bacterium]|nr:extracellular solute-binding protein [Paracoccaceae bacterium]